MLTGNSQPLSVPNTSGNVLQGYCNCLICASFLVIASTLGPLLSPTAQTSCRIFLFLSQLHSSLMISRLQPTGNCDTHMLKYCSLLWPPSDAVVFLPVTVILSPSTLFHVFMQHGRHPPRQSFLLPNPCSPYRIDLGSGNVPNTNVVHSLSTIRFRSFFFCWYCIYNCLELSISRVDLGFTPRVCTQRVNSFKFISVF